MKTALVLLMLALLPLGAFAQKDMSEKQSQITYDIPSNGPQGGVQKNYDRARIDEITAQIRVARTNGDLQKSEQLQNELEKVTGNYSNKVSSNDPLQVHNEVLNQPLEEGDYNLTIINGTDGNWATATSTDRVTGRIYVATSTYNSVGSDTLKLFSSSNNGINWVLVNRISFGSAVVYRNDELDIEAVNNGGTSYCFMVAGLSVSGLDYSYYFRLNSSGGEFSASSLYTPVAGNRFLSPRITSDNSKWATGAFVYFLLTQDSITTGTVHHYVSKFSILTSPFVATPVISERNFTSNGYWWNTYSGDSTVMYNDIAYSDSAGTDCIVTASNFYRAGTITNLYMTRTKDYGATAPTWVPQIVEANINYKPRLAATGLDAAGSQFLMLTYVRKFSATDWDPYYHRTSNNGALWSSGFVDAASDTTKYSDVIAVSRIPNTFRFAYATVTNNAIGKAFARAYNVGTFMGTRLLLTSTASSDFAIVRAGYRLAATDSCFSVVEGISGSGVYAYSGCTGALTGVGNSETPLSFKLSQNYPNPFNPTTKISYALPKSGLVTLRVYDILGKEVATLVNEVKNVGNYSVDFSASNFTSGVYFYKLETNGFSDIKKMMLIK